MIQNARESLVKLIIKENPEITQILGDTSIEFLDKLDLIKRVLLRLLKEHPKAYAYYNGKEHGEKAYFKLSWRDFAFIRILDYLQHEGETFTDQNLHGQIIESHPFELLRDAIQKGNYRATADFYEDLLHLLRQLNGIDRPEIPSRQHVIDWMARHPSGLDEDIIHMRNKNKQRIIRLIYEDMQTGKQVTRFTISPDTDEHTALKQIEAWWENDVFHLSFAVRNVDELQKYLDDSLSDETLRIMTEATKKGIPIFVTPYFLSMLLIRPYKKYTHADCAIRDYVLYSQELVDEFGNISAWEKEDIMEPGKPNAAGWVLPSNNIHRRYPNVAIFIPSTMGRACGGLCAYCQRMYDFQNGRFNFDLERLKPNENWATKLQKLMKYFEEDSQLQDILITGGDAMMSSIESLKQVLDAVYTMAEHKIEANNDRDKDTKHAEIVRVRLGTKIPIYLPQRISSERVAILKDFKERAEKIGIKQFIIQTHFSSAMEITPASQVAVSSLLSAGWIVTNQEVFTVAASRRGHTAKLRETLNTIGVLPYYTFTVKGYHENKHYFANNSRSIQEQVEEKSIGRVDPKYYSQIRGFMKTPNHMKEQIEEIRNAEEIPFLSTDRNTINLPGVGKSNTYRTIGITENGRRILSFEQDHSRPHSPIIDTMDQVIIIESKSVASYLRQLESLGEKKEEYQSIWGYSAGYIEPRIPIYEYPGYRFTVTKEFTNLELRPEQKEIHQIRPTEVEFTEIDQEINEGYTD